MILRNFTWWLQKFKLGNGNKQKLCYWLNKWKLNFLNNKTWAHKLCCPRNIFRSDIILGIQESWEMKLYTWWIPLHWVMSRMFVVSLWRLFIMSLDSAVTVLDQSGRQSQGWLLAISSNFYFQFIWAELWNGQKNPLCLVLAILPLIGPKCFIP